TSSPKPMAWLYGAPWKGAGAASVRITFFSMFPPSSSAIGPRRARQGQPERLEDRLERVTGVLALDQPDVDREPGLHREPGEKTWREVADESGSAGQIG